MSKGDKPIEPSSSDFSVQLCLCFFLESATTTSPTQPSGPGGELLSVL